MYDLYASKDYYNALLLGTFNLTSETIPTCNRTKGHARNSWQQQLKYKFIVAQ